jgi:hypothetical protein
MAYKFVSGPAPPGRASVHRRPTASRRKILLYLPIFPSVASMRISTVAALATIALLTAAPAYAYVDPGTGSMLVQLVTGGVAGALVLARLYWRRLKDKLTGKSSVNPSDGAARSRPDQQ